MAYRSHRAAKACSPEANAPLPRTQVRLAPSGERRAASCSVWPCLRSQAQFRRANLPVLAERLLAVGRLLVARPAKGAAAAPDCNGPRAETSTATKSGPTMPKCGHEFGRHRRPKIPRAHPAGSRAARPPHRAPIRWAKTNPVAPPPPELNETLVEPAKS